MENYRDEQMEALEVLIDFNQRLLKNIPIIVKELTGERLDDTDNFLKGILDAINWEIQVVNGTLDLLNEKEKRIDKESFNQQMIALGEAVKGKQDMKIAAALQNVLPYFENLGKAAEAVVDQNRASEK